jgi:hypothetical protein
MRPTNPASLIENNMSKTYASLPAAIKPHGEPFCVRPENDWVWHWTIAECVQHFEYVPRLFMLIDVASKVAAVWHHLTLEMQSKLDHEFVLYDLRTGRV